MNEANARAREASGEPQPIGKGDFGDIYDQFRGKPKEAIDFLTKKKGGEALGALSHKDIGEIDLVWGEEGTGHSDGYGLAKLVKYHPEVLDNLQEILDEMQVVKRTENRINLESDKYKAAVRLTWNEQSKTWLLTLFEKKNSALDNTTDTAKTSDRGRRNDTATPQSTVSEGKDTKKTVDNQINLGKTSSVDEISSEEAKVDVNPSDGQKEAGSLLDVKEIKDLKGAKRSVIRAIEDYAVIAYRHAYDRIPSYQFGASGDSVERMTLEKFVNAFKEIAGVEAKGTEAYMGAVYDHISNKLSGKGNTIALRSQQEPTEKPEETVAKKEHKRIVSDEQMEELRKKLLAKFNNLNAGIDVERMLLGAMYAVGKIERGVTKFADYAAEMVSEIGDAIRPYLKAFYEAVRNMPEAAEYRDQMDSAEVVAAFDVDNFDKGGKAPDVITKAKQVERNRKARQQVKKIEKEVKKQVERGVRQLDLFSDEVAITSQQTGQTKEAKGKTAWWRDENRPAGLDPKDYRTYTSDEAKAYFAGFRSDDGKVDFTKWAHPNLAYITAAAWDGAVIPVEELMQIAEIQEAEQRVKEKDALPGFHIKKNERHELRDRLLDAEHGSAVFENGKIKKVDGKEVFTGPVRQEKKAFIVVGRPAGGKSSVFANRLSHENGARIVDSDVVKPWLSGYDDGYGAGYVQNASADVATSALNKASDAGDNIVMPRIGGGSVMRDVMMLREKGYDVQIFYNEVSEETSIMRAASRFAQEGRYLSLDYLTQIGNKDSKSFRNFASAKLSDYYDTVERKGSSAQSSSAPVLLAGRGDSSGASREDSGRGDFGRGGSEDVSGVLRGGVQSGEELYRGGKGIPGDERIFSYAEWKSNDVAFGEQPKEIWNSNSGKPMPGKKEEKNDERKVSRKSSPVGEGAGQASGSAQRAGAERGPEQDRAERSGSGRAVEVATESQQTGRVAVVQQQTGQETISLGSGAVVTSGQDVQPQKLHKNRRNNVGERGKDYAPLSPKARFNANVKAIRLMRELMERIPDGEASGTVATKEEMAVLRQYSGWGGLGTYFNDESSAENRMLRDLLTEDEYQDAVMSINSAYYTPATVVDTLWDVAKALGFAGGRVLEGSAGIGNIIGQMPREMSRRSDIEAVEIDTISGNILKLLYPDAKVHIQGFQDTVIPNGSVDLAVTNVPFVTGLHVIDKVDKDLSRRFTNIHDFCIAKNIRKLRDGGLGIFITSSGTMDKSNDLRAWIADEGKADVIGAFRLNNETFGGTKVTSDIIVVRKRRSGDSVATDGTAIDVSKASPMRVGVWTDKYGDEHQVSMVVNDYFKEHPEMMAGEMAFGYEKGDTFRPGSYGLYPAEGKEQGKMLAGFVKRMKEVGAATVSQQSGQAVEADAERNQLTAVKEGRMLVDEKGRLCVSRLGEAVPLGLNEQKVKGYSKQQCFEDYQAVQKAVDDVLQQQLGDPDDSKLEPKLKALNAAFDKFVKRYGTLHKNTSLAFLRNDIDFPSFLALENYSETKDINGKVTVQTSKAPLFRQRVLGFKTEPQPKTVKDAVIASIFRSGGIDVDWIAEKLNAAGTGPWTADDVRKGILVSRLGFEDPSTGELVVRYKYLSGNVREKLAIAEAYNGGDGIATDGTGVAGGGTGRYAGNVEELKKVVPMDIPAHLIDFSLGSSWIPMEVYQDYLKENYDLENVRLTHVEGSWVIGDGYGFRKEKNRAAGVYSEKFRETIYGHQLVAAALNNRPVKVAKQVSEGYGSSKTTRTVVDQAATQACAVRVDEIKDEFKTWAKKKMQDDPELAQRIEKIYNEKFNALVPMEIGDEFLPDVFDGANMNIHLYGHQKRGVMRGVTAPTMLAHEVGTGKSFTLITTAMEMRRLGTAKKPMIVVQNATVAQMTADAKLLYPNAKVLSLSEKDRDAEGRRAFYAKIKYNDWDIIIVPQSTFERIPDSPERELQFIQEKIDEKKHVIEAAMQSNMDSREIQRLKKDLEKLEQEYGDTFLNSDPANGGGRNTTTNKTKKKDAKREAASLDKAETRAKEQLDRAVDDVQYFDDLGVDALLVDEAHEYKHLGFQTSIGRGIKGIDPSYSKKCAGLYNKTRSVFERAGWKNVVFATGTPISNTAAEIWTFMKYLMPADVMKQNDIYYFDDFVHNFGSISQMLEFSTSGKFKENTRFAAYVNKPELIRIWSQVADTVLTKEVGKVQEKIPEMEGGKDQDVFLPQSPSLIRIMAAVRAELERFEKMDGKEKKENSSIPLTMYGIAKRAAIDPRLVDADAPDEPTSKTNAAVKEIVKDLEATKAYRGTVAVFCDNQNRLGRNGNAAKATVEFNIYDDMRDKLIKAGVPAEQIAIVKSGMSIVAKQKIFDAVNAGSIRVVLGSTQTLGTGVNMQERLHLLIHMDAPDRPMDYTQRNGRIKRQGNLHKAWGKTIRVVRFGVEDSLDVTAYQRLKTKSGFIDSIMDGKSALANNQVDRTVEEEEEGLFDNPVAVLSGSQYALKKNQAERELRRYEGKKAQWEADQVYVANALRRNKGVVADAERQIGEEQQMLEHIRSLFPDGKVNTITIQGEQVDAGNTEQLAKVMKEKVNDPVNAIVKRNRENAFYNDEVIPVTIEVDGHAINFEVSVERESVYDGGKMRTVIHKYVTYKSADLREERLMKSSSSVKDLLDEILDEVVTGRDYQERIEFLQQKIARVNGESEQLQQRVGMEFQFGKELEEAKKRVEEYTQLMKQEMAEKEAKYAAESGGRDDIATYMTEEEDSELYRADEDEEMLNSDDESMSSEELLLSLSEKEGDERNETINELIRRVRSGAARIVRMGQEMALDRGNDAEIAGAILGGWELRLSSLADGTLRGMVQGRSEMVQRPGTPGTHPASVREVPIIAWAKATGHYYDEEQVRRDSLDKNVWLSGAQSNVYRSADGKKVIKFMESWVYYHQPLLKHIDGISLQNSAGFDHSTVLGYSLDEYGRLLIVVEQDYVEGVTIDEMFDDDGPARVHSYIDRYLENVLGLEKGGHDDDGNPFHKKDGLIYKDIHGANVLMDRQGTLHIIDGYVSREGDDQKERGAGFSIEDADGDMLREVEQFADGERFDIHTTYGYGNDVLSRGRTFSTDLMPDEYGSVGELVDALRRQYPAYYVSLDGDAVRFERWASVFDAATMSQHRRTRKGTENYLRRKTNNAVGAVWSLAQRMGLDVEVLTSVEGLEGKRARSKGWFNPKTGKITIVLPNHSNQGDVINTLLHEGVAHYGLRKLFGPYFDTFLDNVYNNVDAQVRARIDAAVKKNGWSRHVATEEYLARLAERTDFEHASEYGWWRKIKQFFLKMLADAGLVMSTPLSDNDLRYVLWRSYDNLLHPDGRRSLFDKAREVQMKGKLSVRREVAMPSQQTERAADSGTEVADVNNRLLLERMHRDLKKKYPGALIVFKMPDGSLKAVGADIDAVASAFGRGAWGNDSETEYNVPEARIDWLLPRLVRMGYRIGITDAPTGDVAREGDDIVWYDEASGLSDADLLYSLRTKKAPKKTGIGYKVFVLKDGQLYPPMVANPGGEGTPVGVWLDADAAPIAGQSKTGRPQVKAGGKGTQGGSGQLAYRPGWHLGTIPYALQFNRKDSTGERTLFPNNFVWAEVEYADDVDFQDEARQEGVNANGKYQHSLAGLKHVPTDGSYRYRTNPDPKTDERIITGAMRVNRILSRAEVDDMVRQAGREPQPMQDGDILTQDIVDELNAEIQATREADEMGLLFRADEDREDVNTISVTVNEYNKSLLKPEAHVSWARQLFSREWRKYNGGRLREAWQDSMLALKRGQDIIVKYSGKPLKDYEDAYTLENLSHGRAKNEYEWFDRNLYKPLLRSFWRLQKAVGASEEDVHKYLFCKHGLERNVEMAFRDAVNKDVTAAQKKYQEDLKKWKEESKVATQSQQTGPEKPEEPKGALDIHKAYREDEDRVVNEMAWRRGLIDYQTYRETDDAIRTKYAPDYLEFRSKDYAGLTGLFATEHVESDGMKVTDYPPIEDAEAAALAAVKGMEGRPLRTATVSQHRGTNVTAKGLCDDLWEKINGCTKWTLLKSYQSGQMSKAMYEHVRDMFEHYIPLRGWDGTNAQDVYDYVGGRAGVFSKSVIPAKGRTSVADNPIAYIGNMAMSGIVIGQKNMVKQRLLNLARNHKSDLLSVHGAWYQNVGSDEDPLWQSVTADIPDDASAQEVADIIDAFERRMEALKKDGKATQDRAHLNIVYPAPSQQLKEHEVHVMENGKEYVIYVNGDPRLAQAVNGTRQRKAQEGHTGFINQLAAKSGRFKAAIYTSFSPAFIVTNWTRDITMAIASSLIDHGVMYNARAARNTAALLNPLNKNNIFRLMWLYTHDQLDMRSSTQRMFKEFMAEGAETGFIAQLDLESFKNGINKELGRANQAIVDPRRVFRGYLQLTEFLNRCIEDSNRFVVYRTSRERGGDGIATNGTGSRAGTSGTGVSAMRAAAAAKDVTLNFNRKGSGEWGNALARGAFIFVNPAIQGIQTLFRLAKGHPFKFTGVTAGWVLAGAMMPYVNAMLVQLLGGDDGDDDAYWQLPEHVRRQCLCLYVGDGDFLTIPLAQEFRTFWGIGEQAAARTMGHGKESVTEEGMDIVESFLDLLPLDLMGHGVRDAKWASHDWWVGMGLNFTPDLIKTELESLANRDFTGKPVYRSNEWNKHLPEWTKSFKGTPEWITKSTELLNTLTGGEGTWKSGWADINPSVIDHELRGWVGGPFNFGAGIISTAVKLFNGDDVKVYDVPVLNRLLNSPSERETKDGLPQSYWKMYIEEWKPLQQTLSEMKKQALAGNNDAFRALEEFYRGDEYQRYADIERQVEAADALRKSAGNGDSFEASEAAKKETPAERYKALRTGKDVFEDWCVDAIGDRTLSVQKEAEALRQSRNRQDGDADAYRREHALELDARRAVEQYRKLANFHKQRLGHGGDDADAKAMGAIRRERDKVLRRYLFEDIFQ